MGDGFLPSRGIAGRALDRAPGPRHDAFGAETGLSPNGQGKGKSQAQHFAVKCKKAQDAQFRMGFDNRLLFFDSSKSMNRGDEFGISSP